MFMDFLKYFKFIKLKVRRNRISTLDKFILKQVIEIFLLGVIIFTSIIFASDTFISLIKQISMYGMSVNIAILIILLNLPAVIVMTIPMSVLFASVMTVNKMCLQSEITVMKACGISINRISKPIFIFAAFMALFTFIINETIVPATIAQSKVLAIYAMVQHNIPNGKKNFTIKELKDGYYLKRLFYVEKCENEKFHNISVLDLSDEKEIKILAAQTGTSDPEGWKFNNASGYYISKENKSLDTTWKQNTIINFGSDIQKQLDKKNDGADSNILELLSYIKNPEKIQIGKENQLDENDKREEREYILNKYKMTFWNKITFPITSLIFVLVGIPLAITPPRVRHNRGFLFCIAVIFIFYVIRAFSTGLGEHGVIWPLIASNLPNLIIGTAGCLMYINKAFRIK